jgi:hypothetical protein
MSRSVHLAEHLTRARHATRLNWDYATNSSVNRYESASRASAVLALNVEDLGLPNKQSKITAKGGDIMWITWAPTPPTCCPA